MHIPNKILKQNARESLKGRGAAVVVAAMLAIYLDGAAFMVTGWPMMILNALGLNVAAVAVFLATLVVTMTLMRGPLTLGFAGFILNSDTDRAEVAAREVLSGFKRWRQAAKAWVIVYGLIFPLSLLLIIPGVVAMYSFSMTFFIMQDNPDMTAWQAICRSRQMMRGNRWRLFCLDMRFAWWWLLWIPTMSLISLWLMPYWTTAWAGFYRNLLQTPEAPVAETPETPDATAVDTPETPEKPDTV